MFCTSRYACGICVVQNGEQLEITRKAESFLISFFGTALWLYIFADLPPVSSRLCLDPVEKEIRDVKIVWSNPCLQTGGPFHSGAVKHLSTFIWSTKTFNIANEIKRKEAWLQMSSTGLIKKNLSEQGAFYKHTYFLFFFLLPTQLFSIISLRQNEHEHELKWSAGFVALFRLSLLDMGIELACWILIEKARRD